MNDLIIPGGGMDDTLKPGDNRQIHRLKTIQEHINRLVADLPSPKGYHPEDDDARTHLSGVSTCCVLLALKRGLDPELAAVSGLLHDIYRFKTGIGPFHAHNGAEMARVLLKRMGDCFSEDEKRIILSAVFHHGDKKGVRGVYDELLKDADTLSPFLYEGGVRYASPALMYGARRKRLKKIFKELDLSIKIPKNKKQAERPPVIRVEPIDKRLLLADTAEKLASSPLEGSRRNPVYMDMIRCWPEDTAFDELLNSWCAAFVYHCCQMAGFILPICWPTEKHRFAGVSAWNSWARSMKYFIKDGPGFIPQRGDIILYRNIIPPENKPEDQRDAPIDHIGVVLSADGENYTAAEGNVNNLNVSGIVTRKLHQNTEGYIRIDDSFDYKDWAFSFNKDIK